MDVRPCDREDLDRLVHRWPTAGAVHEAHFDEQRDGGATYLVAWHDGDPVGSALVQWHGPVGANARARYPACPEINHLHVRPDSRGHGVGTAIIRAAETLASSRAHTSITVAVGVDNAGAARLYERLGYRATGAIDVSEYDWLDDDGRTHHEVETDELLVKDL